MFGALEQRKDVGFHYIKTFIGEKITSSLNSIYQGAVHMGSVEFRDRVCMLWGAIENTICEKVNGKTRHEPISIEKL